MTAGFVLAVASLCLILCGGWFLVSRMTAESRADKALRAAANRLNNELRIKSGAALSAELLEEEQDLSYVGMAVLIVGKDGRVSYASRGKGPGWPLQSENGWRAVSVPSESGTIVIAMPWRETEFAFKRETYALLGLCMVIVTVCGACAWVLVGRTLAPIAALAQQARAASADDLSVRLTPPSGDSEVVRLVETLNGLLGRLTEAAAAKGRFYSAASHELRTPLQALSGHLELAVTRQRSADEYRAVIEESLLQTRRLIGLVQDLLTLHRIETSTESSAATPVDLSDVCLQAVSRVELRARERNVEVSCELANRMATSAPAGQVEILVRNLVENAVSHGVEGGTVSIELAPSAANPQLTISNGYPSESNEDPGRWLDPFHRVDPARSTETGGNGLGLAICKAIVDANGWSMNIRREENRIVTAVRFAKEPEIAA